MSAGIGERLAMPVTARGVDCVYWYRREASYASYSIEVLPVSAGIGEGLAMPVTARGVPVSAGIGDRLAMPVTA